LLNNPEISIKIIGKDVKMTNGYGKRVEKLAFLQQNTFIMTQRLTDIELGRTMANAHVHYLASFCEPSALTSIEALACGLNIVVSDENYCPTRSYYGGLLNKRVFTCDPFDVGSIREAILNALKTPSDRSAIKDFSWEKTAAQTYNAYRQVLEQV
jgi:glycosyltransferase involved in cell wall biosynthesis